MSSLTSITNAVGDAALPFWLLIRSEPLAGPPCANEVQVLNQGLLTLPAQSSAISDNNRSWKSPLKRAERHVRVGQRASTAEPEWLELICYGYECHRSTHGVPRAPRKRGFAIGSLKFSGKQGRKLVSASGGKKSFAMKIFGQKHVCLRTCALLLYTPM